MQRGAGSYYTNTFYAILCTQNNDFRDIRYTKHNMIQSIISFFIKKITYCEYVTDRSGYKGWRKKFILTKFLKFPIIRTEI